MLILKKKINDLFRNKRKIRKRDLFSLALQHKGRYLLKYQNNLFEIFLKDAFKSNWKEILRLYKHSLPKSTHTKR